MSSKHLAAPTLPFRFGLNQAVMHKNGDVYFITGLPDEYRIEATGEPAYAYQKSVNCQPTGYKWIRAQSIMEEGDRFTPVDISMQRKD